MCKFGDGWYQIEQVPKKISLHSRVVFANSSVNMTTSLRIQPSSIASAGGNFGFSLSRYAPLLFKRAKLLSFCCLILNYPNLRDLSGSLTTNRTACWGLGMKLTRLPRTAGPFVFSVSPRGGGGIFLFQLLLNKPGIKERILFYLRKSRRRTLPQFEYLWQDSRRLLSDGCSKSGILSDR